jgi:hypothetical protein
MPHARNVAVGLVAAAVITLAGSSAALGAPAASDGAPPQAGPPGWVDLPQQANEHALSGSHRDTIRGTRSGNGDCLFKIGLKLAKGQAAVEAREIARNDSTCQEVVEIGTPDPADVHAQSPASPDQATKGDRVHVQVRPGGPSPDRSAGRRPQARRWIEESAGYMHTWWVDPIGLVVNEVYNDVDWYWDGWCNDGFAWSGYYYTWLTASGWQLRDNNWYWDSWCDYTLSSSYVHFKNPYFCAFFDTDAYYNRNEAYGWYDGYLTGYVYSWVSGSVCRYLLSGRYQLVRTYN